MKLIYISILMMSSYLLSAQCYSDRHSTNWFDGWVSCHSKTSPNPSNTAGHWLLYDLGNRYKIDKLKIWNSNDPSHLDWGMKEVKVDYSKDSIVWKTIGILDLEKATGTNRYEGMDWLNVSIPDAKFILLTAVSNFGRDSCYGLAEIRFSAEKLNLTKVNELSENENIQTTVSPNPFTELFYTHIVTSNPEILSYQCTDITGKIYTSGSIQMEKSNYILKIETKNWPPGSYVLSVRNGRDLTKNSIIKL